MVTKETIDNLNKIGNPFLKQSDAGISLPDDDDLVWEGMIKMTKWDVRKSNLESERKAREKSYKEAIASKSLSGVGASMSMQKKPEDAMKDFQKEKTVKESVKPIETQPVSKGIFQHEWYDIIVNEYGTATFKSKDPEKYGPTRTFQSLDLAKQAINKGVAKNKTVQSVAIDMNHPDEKKAIATFEELKKANPNLNITTSISDYMRARKLDSSFANRAKIAEKFGIKNYTGTGAQNIALFKKIQEEDNNTLTM